MPLSWQGRRPQRKLTLQRLEASYALEEVVGSANLTIEHVLPQAMSSAVRAGSSSASVPGERQFRLGLSTPVALETP